MIKLALKFSGQTKYYDLPEPKVKHLTEASSRVRGMDNPSDIHSVACLLEVLSEGKVTVDEFMDSDACNIQGVTKALEPFLS